MSTEFKNSKPVSIKKAAIFIAVFMTTIFVFAATPGQVVQNIKIQNPEGVPTYIPYYGQKLITIFYNDPGTADIADPLADALKAKKFPAEKYAGIGIANCKDTMIPNYAIKKVLASKAAKFKSIMLADIDHSIKKGWGLANCDDTCAVIVIGKDKKLKLITYIKSQNQARGATAAVLALIEKELKN